jgi:hypothetical protein
LAVLLNGLSRTAPGALHETAAYPAAPPVSAQPPSAPHAETDTQASQNDQRIYLSCLNAFVYEQNGR